MDQGEVRLEDRRRRIEGPRPLLCTAVSRSEARTSNCITPESTTLLTGADESIPHGLSKVLSDFGRSILHPPMGWPLWGQ